MPKGRDWLWAIGICGAFLLLFHYRPLWSARRFVQRESEAGFLEAYAGHRWLDGTLISRAGGEDTAAEVMATPVVSRRLHVQAEEISFDGRRAELVVRHVIRVAGAMPGGEDRSQEIHVKLRRRGSRWEYTHFQRRGHRALDPPIEGNPWAAKE